MRAGERNNALNRGIVTTANAIVLGDMIAIKATDLGLEGAPPTSHFSRNNNSVADRVSHLRRERDSHGTGALDRSVRRCRSATTQPPMSYLIGYKSPLTVLTHLDQKGHNINVFNFVN
jgi:hypothetical protein